MTIKCSRSAGAQLLVQVTFFLLERVLNILVGERAPSHQLIKLTFSKARNQSEGYSAYSYVKMRSISLPHRSYLILKVSRLFLCREHVLSLITTMNLILIRGHSCGYMRSPILLSTPSIPCRPPVCTAKIFLPAQGHDHFICLLDASLLGCAWIMRHKKTCTPKACRRHPFLGFIFRWCGYDSRAELQTKVLMGVSQAGIRNTM